MPGSGVNEDTVREIVSKTATTEIHCSAAVNVESTMNSETEYSGNGFRERIAYSILTVDPAVFVKSGNWHNLCEGCRKAGVPMKKQRGPKPL